MDIGVIRVAFHTAVYIAQGDISTYRSTPARVNWMPLGAYVLCITSNCASIFWPWSANISTFWDSPSSPRSGGQTYHLVCNKVLVCFGADNVKPHRYDYIRLRVTRAWLLSCKLLFEVEQGRGNWHILVATFLRTWNWRSGCYDGKYGGGQD